MPREIKSRNENGLRTDFSITDAIKRKKARLKQLEKASGYEMPNEHDMMSDEIDNYGSESDEVRSIFED